MKNRLRIAALLGCVSAAAACHSVEGSSQSENLAATQATRQWEHDWRAAQDACQAKSLLPIAHLQVFDDKQLGDLSVTDDEASAPGLNCLEAIKKAQASMMAEAKALAESKHVASTHAPVDRDDGLSTASQALTSNDSTLCKAIRPYLDLTNTPVYMNTGVQLAAKVGLLGGEGGCELTYNLTDAQHVAFCYVGVGQKFGVAASVGPYIGVALDTVRTNNIIDAWSGVFFSPGANLEFPLPLPGKPTGSVSGFASMPGSNVKGITAGMSWGVVLREFEQLMAAQAKVAPLGLKYVVSDNVLGTWFPINAATVSWFNHTRSRVVDANKNRSDYLAFSNSPRFSRHSRMAADMTSKLMIHLAVVALAFGALETGRESVTALCR